MPDSIGGQLIERQHHVLGASLAHPGRRRVRGHRLLQHVQRTAGELQLQQPHPARRAPARPARARRVPCPSCHASRDPHRQMARTRRQGDNDGTARDDKQGPAAAGLYALLDGGRPSGTRGWVNPVAPVVTQAAAGAGHWAAGRRQRALAEWAGAAGFGLVAWALGTEAPTRTEALENLAALAGTDEQQRRDFCASLPQGPRLPPRRKHPRPAGYRGSSAGSALFPRLRGWSSACRGACATRSS